MALSIAYGIQADAPDNEFLRLYKKLVDVMNESMVPGSFLVDLLPFRGSHRFGWESANQRRAATVRHLPSWFPGVRFHAYAKKANQDFRAAITRPGRTC